MQEEDKLFENLILNRDLIDARMPFFSNYGNERSFWSGWCYGSKIDILNSFYPTLRNSRYKDIVYTNDKGQLHRLYGPAYISRDNKIEAWFKEGILHREDGPAYIRGSVNVYCVNGILHREDGPAVIELAGPKQYWINGVKYSKKQYHWEINRKNRKKHV